jgi:hypothetical protein
VKKVFISVIAVLVAVMMITPAFADFACTFEGKAGGISTFYFKYVKNGIVSLVSMREDENIIPISGKDLWNYKKYPNGLTVVTSFDIPVWKVLISDRRQERQNFLATMWLDNQSINGSCNF